MSLDPHLWANGRPDGDVEGRSTATWASRLHAAASLGLGSHNTAWQHRWCRLLGIHLVSGVPPRHPAKPGAPALGSTTQCTVYFYLPVLMKLQWLYDFSVLLWRCSKDGSHNDDAFSDHRVIGNVFSLSLEHSLPWLCMVANDSAFSSLRKV